MKKVIWNGEEWRFFNVLREGDVLKLTLCKRIETADMESCLNQLKESGQTVESLNSQQMYQWTDSLSLNIKIDAFLKGTNEKYTAKWDTDGFVWCPLPLPDVLESKIDRDCSEAAVEKLGLEKDCCWTGCSLTFQVPASVDTSSLVLTLIQHPQVLSDLFSIESEGQKILFTHPVTGKSHTIEIKEYEQVSEEEGERMAVLYSVEPPLNPQLEEFSLIDWGDGREIPSFIYYELPENNYVDSSFYYDQLPEKIFWRMRFKGKLQHKSIAISDLEETDAF